MRTLPFPFPLGELGTAPRLIWVPNDEAELVEDTALKGGDEGTGVSPPPMEDEEALEKKRRSCSETDSVAMPKTISTKRQSWEEPKIPIRWHAEDKDS